MKKLLIMSLFIIMAVLSFLGDAFSCGMKMRGMMRNMSHQERMQSHGEMTSHALSHDDMADETAMEHEALVSDVEPARLVESRCSRCHSLRFISRSRKEDWSRTVYRMNNHIVSRNMPSLTDQEKGIIIGYLNTHYSTAN